MYLDLGQVFWGILCFFSSKGYNFQILFFCSRYFFRLPFGPSLFQCSHFILFEICHVWKLFGNDLWVQKFLAVNSVLMWNCEQWFDNS